MWDFNIIRTFGLMMRTLPFILVRMAVYFAITLAYIVVTGAGSGIGYGVGQIAEDPATYAVWGAFLGFGLASVGVYWIREYILYVVKAGHIAVMVDLLDGRTVGRGYGQIAHARETVTARFGETNVLFALDQLIKGVIGAITGLIGGIAVVLPIPGLNSVARFVNAVIRMSLIHVDEVILAYNIRTGSTNPWESSRHGLVLYAQNARVMIRNAVWLTLIVWVLSIAIFLVMVAPAAALVYALPGQFTGWSFVLAIVFAWAFKAALLEPFAIAALMDVYFRTIEGQTPDPAWDAKLLGASERFADIAGKASAQVFGRTPGSQAAAPQSL